MIGAAVCLFAVGLADLVAGGLKGMPVSRKRALIGLAAGTMVYLAGGFMVTWSGRLLAIVTVGLVGLAAWLLVRSASGPGGSHGRPHGRPRAWLALGLLMLHIGVGVGTEAAWPSRTMDGLGRWLDGLAFPALTMLEADSLFLIVGLFLFTAATTNGVVRLVLIAADTEAGHSEERLRGGRIIGVLERWMILALMLAGYPTAAGLVISAKSILRFPELNRVAAQSSADRVDQVTEYFLLGSLVSWLVAVVLALLFVGPF